MRVVSNGRRRGGVSRIITISLVLVIILLTAVWFGVRSEGGRELIESQLSSRIGIPVSIEKTRIGLPYVLVMENVRTADFEAAGTAGFSISEVRLGRRLLSWDLRLRQLMVRLQEDGSDGWLPACLVRLGDLQQAGTRDLVRLSDGVRNRFHLRLQDSSLAWLDTEGREVASVRGVEFCMLPVRIEERRLHYFSLGIYQAVGVAIGEGRDIRREWLTTQELEYIELSNASQHASAVYAEDDSDTLDINFVTD